jgi:hypothetical protein
MVTLHGEERTSSSSSSTRRKTNAGRPPELGADLYLQYRGTQSRAAATNKRPVLVVAYIVTSYRLQHKHKT